MSTIGSLLLAMDPGIKPWSEGMQSVNRAQLGSQEAQTGLIKLAQLKQSQASEQEVMAAIQRDPSLQALLFGGGMPQSTLGSLQTAPASPPGPMTQQSVMPGQPPGAPQMVPGGQDLSQFATQGQPGTPTLATLGGQPQGPPQAPQNPVLEMARRDPRAAMMLQQQMQTQQDRQWKMQEQGLSNRIKVVDYLSRMAQGATDQDSWKQFIDEADRVQPGAGGRLPQMYSKEARDRVVSQGISAKDRAESLYHEAKARNLDMETRMFPELAKRFGMEGDAQTPAQEGAQPLVATGGGGANMGQRMNNPYNIKLGKGTQHWVDEGLAEVGESAQDGGKFIKFKDPQVGERAGLELLQGPGYRELSVDAAMKRWSNNGYGAEIITDIPPETKIKDLSAAQMRPLMAAMREREGWNAKPTGGGAAQAPAADPRIAQLETKIAQRTRDAQIASLMKNESLSTRLEDEAKRLRDERTRLLEESRRQQERAEEIPRAVAKKTAETEEAQRLERQRQAGPMLPEDRRKLLTGLRTDIRAEPTFKLYQDVRNGYQNVRIGAETDSGQGDLAIINGMAKILDPNSTVMSGEARNVETAQGELERWFNSPQRFFTGDRLTPENRQRFLKLAHAMAKEKLTTARTELTTVYEPLAKEGNISFGQLLPLEDLKPIGPGPNVGKFDKILEKAEKAQ